MTADQSPAGWTVGSTLRTVLVLAGRHFPAFFIVALVFNGPLVAVNLLDAGQAALLAISGLSNVFLAICFTYGVAQALSGKTPDARSMLLQIVRPKVGLWLTIGMLQAAAVFIGFVFLLAPGLYLHTIWMVTIPAAMAEGLGFRAAFSRSFELTKGRRWRTLFASLSCFIIAASYFAVLFPLLGALGISIQSDTFKLISLITGSLTKTIVYVVAPVIYIALREEKESVHAQDIATALNRG